MNYTTLKKSVEDWIERDDLTEYWPTITELAEADLNADFALLGHEKSLTMAVTGTLLNLPEDFLQMRTIQEIYTIQGEPCGYQIMGGDPKQLLISPEIHIGDQIELYYYAKDPSLLVNSTNSLLKEHPNVVMWKYCEHAAINVQEPEAESLFSGRYERARHKANKLDFRTRFSGKAERTGIRLP